MTRRQLIYLIGAPGSGKSTLMAQLTKRWERVPVGSVHTGGLPRDYLLNPDTAMVEAVELGRRRANFSGTDALSMSIIGTAIDYMINQAETDLVFAEGARLGVRRFLASAAATGYAVILGYLDHPLELEWRTSRALATGTTQNPSWVAGRATAARNLANDPPAGVTVISGHPDTLLWEIEGLYHERMML